MIKRIVPFIAAAVCAAFVCGCGPAEDKTNVPTTTNPGADGGPQLSDVSGAGGGTAQPAQTE